MKKINFKDILGEIEKAQLIGRGGAGFPVHLKWKAVKDNPDKEKYLVINGAEGEPGVYKDGYILKNHLSDLVFGIKVAFNFIKPKKIYFYLNSESFRLYQTNISKEMAKVSLSGKFEFIKKPEGAGYIGGEESTILNIIEGKRVEPRVRPPFPVEAGLFAKPTLINNIETLYNVSLVANNRFQKDRFYSINFAYNHKGVYALPDSLTIEQVLKKTGNYPDYDFFVQVGGDACGEVLSQKQLKKVASGAASITIYNLKDHQPESLINYWLTFFKNSSCGQCTPCREGSYRLLEMFQNEKMMFNKNKDFADLMENFSSSLCALGASVPVPISTYLKNVYPLIKIKK